MNGEPLPWLNGFPLRLIVPGWYGDYWIKMLSDIEVLDAPDENYWEKTAYRVPDTPQASVKPGESGFKTVPVGFIPGGGTSVLPRALGLPHDPVTAAAQLADALASGRVRRISLGRVNGRRFTFSAGIGFDAEAVRRMDARGRREDGRRPGDLVFAATLVRVAFERRVRYDPVLEISGLGRAAFAFVANADPYTFAKRIPLHVAPEANFEGGLDVVAPVRVRLHTIPRLLRYVVTGRGQESAPDVLYAHDRDRVEIACDAPLPLQADGEDLVDVERAVFEAERGALRVLV